MQVTYIYLQYTCSIIVIIVALCYSLFERRKIMRIQIIEEPTIDEIEIQIKCKKKNEYVKQLAATIFEE